MCGHQDTYTQFLDTVEIHGLCCCVLHGNDNCNTTLQRLDVRDWASGDYPGGVYLLCVNMGALKNPQHNAPISGTSSNAL